MNLKENLEQVGLSERESRVYLALLDVGPTTTSKLIRKTGIASSKIYDVLEKLEHKGIVTHILEKGKKKFHPANPEKLFDLMKEKESIIENSLSMLKTMYNKTSEEVQAEIYKGSEGLKTIFEDVIKEKNDLFVIGSDARAINILPYYMPHFYTKMYKCKLKLNILSVDNENTRKQKQELIKTHNFVKVKFLPKTISDLMVVFIYGKKVALIPISESTEMSPLIILVKSQESAEGYRNYFNWLWKLCK